MKPYELQKLRTYLRSAGWHKNDIGQYYHPETDNYKIYSFDSALRVQSYRDGLYQAIAGR